jgi:hypothetical protein
MVLASAMLVGAPPPVWFQEPDYRGEARAAAYRYEALIRRRAPSRAGGSSDLPCDEVIGRFCFRFTDDESSSPPPEPEHEDVIAARRLAVRAFRGWLSSEPDQPEAAGGLVRYLIEDDRAREAVSAARTHAWAAPGPGSQLLLGLALHYAADFPSAEAAFDSARGLATEEERAQLDDVRFLLEGRERSWYEDLAEEEKAAYLRRFWAFSDPALRVPGNERRSAHYARHAWIRILSEAPRVEGMLAWGRDHEQILIRFGLPRSLARVEVPAWLHRQEATFISYYDPDAVSFVPFVLSTEGIPPTPDPGAQPALEENARRSIYAPLGPSRRTRALEAQATRLPGHDGWTLRIDAVLAPDTALPTPVAPRGLLTILDTLGQEVTRVPARVGRGWDSLTVVRAEAPVPGGTYVYQLEVGDDSTGVGGLARYSFEIREGDLALSDPLIATAPSGPVPTARSELTPSPGAVLAPEQTVLVYAETRGLARGAGTARYAVEWWLESLERGSLVGQAFRWVGRRLGLAGDSAPVRVSWEAASDGGDPVPIVFALDLAGVEPGTHRLGLRVVDRVTGREVMSERTVRLDPRWPRLSAPDPD